MQIVRRDKAGAREDNGAMRPSLVAVLLVFAACRQDNPDWLGPATAPSGTDDSGGDDAMGPTDESGATTMESSACAPEGWGCGDGEICGPEGCQAGVEGDPCTAPTHCGATAPYCGPGGTCQDGGEGDPCDADDHCSDEAPICNPDGFCQDGNVGDRCESSEDCTEGSRHCGDDGICYAGEPGDKCQKNPDCKPAVLCIEGICGGG